jgi:hypothetical protein
LNHADLEWFAATFGTSLRMEADYTHWLNEFVANRPRKLIGRIIEEEPYRGYLANESHSFLRTQTFFKRCMKLAGEEYGWEHKKLR